MFTYKNPIILKTKMRIKIIALMVLVCFIVTNTAYAVDTTLAPGLEDHRAALARAAQEAERGTAQLLGAERHLAIRLGFVEPDDVSPEDIVKIKCIWQGLALASSHSEIPGDVRTLIIGFRNSYPSSIAAQGTLEEAISGLWFTVVHGGEIPKGELVVGGLRIIRSRPPQSGQGGGAETPSAAGSAGSGLADLLARSGLGQDGPVQTGSAEIIGEELNVGPIAGEMLNMIRTKGADVSAAIEYALENGIGSSSLLKALIMHIAGNGFPVNSNGEEIALLEALLQKQTFDEIEGIGQTDTEGFRDEMASCATDLLGVLEGQSSQRPELRRYVMEFLGDIGGPKAVTALIRILNNGDFEDRKTAAEALAEIGPDAKDATRSLVGVLNNNNGQSKAAVESRIAAARALVAIGTKEPYAAQALLNIILQERELDEFLPDEQKGLLEELFKTAAAALGRIDSEGRVLEEALKEAERAKRAAVELQTENAKGGDRELLAEIKKAIDKSALTPSSKEENRAEYRLDRIRRALVIASSARAQGLPPGMGGIGVQLLEQNFTKARNLLVEGGEVGDFLNLVGGYEGVCWGLLGGYREGLEDIISSYFTEGEFGELRAYASEWAHPAGRAELLAILKITEVKQQIKTNLVNEQTIVVLEQLLNSDACRSNQAYFSEVLGCLRDIVHLPSEQRPKVSLVKPANPFGVNCLLVLENLLAEAKSNSVDFNIAILNTSTQIIEGNSNLCQGSTVRAIAKIFSIEGEGLNSTKSKAIEALGRIARALKDAGKWPQYSPKTSTNKRMIQLICIDELINIIKLPNLSYAHPEATAEIGDTIEAIKSEEMLEDVFSKLQTLIDTGEIDDKDAINKIIDRIILKLIPREDKNHPIPQPPSLYYSQAMRQMLANPTFSRVEKWSIIPLTVFRFINKFGWEFTEENIALALDIILRLRTEVAPSLDVFAEGRKVLILLGDDSDSKRLISLAERAGVSEIEEYKGEDKKEDFLKAVAESKGPLTIYAFLHGFSKKVFLGEDDTTGITFEELGYALLSRFKNDEGLGNVVVVFDTCCTYRFCQNLRAFLASSGVTEMPVTCYTSNFGGMSYIGSFIYGLEKAYSSDGEPLTVGHLLEAVEIAFEQQHGGVSVTIPKAVLDGLPKDLGEQVAGARPFPDEDPYSVEIGFSAAPGSFNPENFDKFGEIADQVIAALGNGEFVMPIKVVEGKVQVSEGKVSVEGTEIKITTKIDPAMGLATLTEDGKEISINVDELNNLFQGKGLDGEVMVSAAARVLIHEIAEAVALQEGFAPADAHYAGMMAEAMFTNNLFPEMEGEKERREKRIQLVRDSLARVLGERDNRLAERSGEPTSPEAEVALNVVEFTELPERIRTDLLKLADYEAAKGFCNTALGNEGLGMEQRQQLAWLKDIMEIELEVFKDKVRPYQMFIKSFLSPNAIIVIAKTEEGRVIGYAEGLPLEAYAFLISDDDRFGRGDTVYSEAIAVREEFRGRGFGSLLLDEFISKARERGFSYRGEHIDEKDQVMGHMLEKRKGDSVNGVLVGTLRQYENLYASQTGGSQLYYRLNLSPENPKQGFSKDEQIKIRREALKTIMDIAPKDLRDDNPVNQWWRAMFVRLQENLQRTDVFEDGVANLIEALLQGKLDELAVKFTGIQKNVEGQPWLVLFDVEIAGIVTSRAVGVDEFSIETLNEKIAAAKAAAEQRAAAIDEAMRTAASQPAVQGEVRLAIVEVNIAGLKALKGHIQLAEVPLALVVTDATDDEINDLREQGIMAAGIEDNNIKGAVEAAVGLMRSRLTEEEARQVKFSFYTPRDPSEVNVQDVRVEPLIDNLKHILELIGVSEADIDEVVQALKAAAGLA